MHTDKRRLELDKITEKIIGCAFKISNSLGNGFLEKIYENAMFLELQKTGLKVKQQHGIQVRYEGAIIGDYTADLLVEDSVIVELKTVKSLDNAHSAQCLNYLKATGLSVCLLINFGKPSIDIKRIVQSF